ncbi:DUF636 domain protein [Mytilinidion resinicola]|uniref:DUF636 domain protein n=1 Tax=Mytilinidion resinicola TaxID=574789 RepID=A0A6A6Y3A3_9PEZI|nr:DUF636 domain protein [Mytilinidion resinicola]KAF2802705.1 DUF636 domain protein [Mytilinidion resinicola]
MSTATPSTQTGSCLCGAVTYNLTGAPFSSFLCHCANCRKFTGSTYQANSMYAGRDSLTVTKGESNLSVHAYNNTTSGNTLRRHFCKSCGSPLFIYPDAAPGVVVVMSGGLDDPAAFAPTKECFVKDRLPWVTPIEAAQFEAVPPHR